MTSARAAAAALAAVALVGSGAGVVRAEPAAARVDWGRGLVIADGLGVADRHAPSPAVALGTSRRGGEDRARAVLATAVRALPMAGGGTVADRLRAAKDPAIAARLDRAVADALVIAAEPETDGSWHVSLAVPIEAVRQAVVGPRALAGGDRGAVPVVVVVVDGAGAAPPAVGYTVAGSPAATVWPTELPAWARDAPHVRARKVARGAIDVALPAGAGAATVFVVAVIARPTP